MATYKQKYNKKFGYSKDESHSLKEISKDTGVSLKGLQQIYNKGIGAYKTNPESVRPNVKSKEQWAMARVYSAVMGGKASKIDEKELEMKSGGKVNSKKGYDYGCAMLYFDNKELQKIHSQIDEDDASKGSAVTSLFYRCSKRR